MDQSGLYALEDVLISLESTGTEVLFVNLLPQPRYMMERVDIIPDLVSEEHIFDDYDACLAWVKTRKWGALG